MNTPAQETPYLSLLIHDRV